MPWFSHDMCDLAAAYPSDLGVLADDAAGMRDTDIIYNDRDIEQLASIPRTQPHREVDLTVLTADQEGELDCA